MSGPFRSGMPSNLWGRTNVNWYGLPERKNAKVDSLERNTPEPDRLVINNPST